LEAGGNGLGGPSHPSFSHKSEREVEQGSRFLVRPPFLLIGRGVVG